MTLVDLQQVRDYAGIAAEADEAMLSALLTQVEAAFLAAVGRTGRPFQTGTTRTEVHDGTGDADLFLDYPVSALTTTVTLGYASPWDESLDPTDPEVLQFAAGSRRLSRVDGGTFGTEGQRRYVRVTYTSADDLPEDVVVAIVRMTAALYREAGRPESTADRVLPDGELLPAVADREPFWQLAVAAHYEPRC